MIQGAVDRMLKAALVIAGVFLFAPVGASAQVRFSIIGEGSNTCGLWVNERRADSTRVTPSAAWILGYITAASFHRAPGTPNFARGIDGSAVDLWVDNYCATHPLETIQSAAEELVNELIQRSR